MFSGIFGFGDWQQIITDLPHQALLRTVIAISGLTLYSPRRITSREGGPPPSVPPTPNTTSSAACLISPVASSAAPPVRLTRWASSCCSSPPSRQPLRILRYALARWPHSATASGKVPLLVPRLPAWWIAAAIFAVAYIVVLSAAAFNSLIRESHSHSPPTFQPQKSPESRAKTRRKSCRLLEYTLLRRLQNALNSSVCGSALPILFPARLFWRFHGTSVLVGQRSNLARVVRSESLYVATESKGQISLHQISRRTGERIRHQKVLESAAESKEATTAIENDEIVKGYEYSKGKISSSLSPANSKTCAFPQSTPSRWHNL